MPVETAESTGDDHALAVGSLTTGVAENWRAVLVLETEKVDALEVVLTTLDAWRRLDILAVWASGDTLKVLANILWKMEGDWVLLLNELEQWSPETAWLVWLVSGLTHNKWWWTSVLVHANSAVPLVWELILSHWWVKALKVERASAAIAANEIAATVARCAKVIVVVLERYVSNHVYGVAW